MARNDDGVGQVPAPSLIVAEVGEAGARDEVRRAAVDLAERTHARLVLYDADADSLLADPMPSNWSAEGADEEFGDLLSPDDLEVLGRGELRAMVADARTRGVEAHGWLAGGRGIDSIARYAERIAADLILIPAAERQAGLLGGGEGEVLEAAHEIPAGVRVGLVHADGRVEYRGGESPLA